MHYRGYIISNDGTRHHANSTDGDSLVLKSLCHSRVTRAIDQLWQTLADFDRCTPIEMLPAPRWIRQWLTKGSNVIDLDLAHAGVT